VVNHEGIQRKLLAEKNLTYEKALEIALTMETAEKGTKDLKANDSLKDIHYTPLQKPKQRPATGRSKTQSAIMCYRCMGEHLANVCKFCTTECYLCKKVGHIAKACKSKQKGKKSQPVTPKSNHYVEDEVTTAATGHKSSPDSSYGMFTVEGNSPNPIIMQVDINQVPVEMEVDTGASLSLINKATYDRICSRSHTQALQKTDVHLKTYTGEALCILGTAKIQVKYGEITQQLHVYVVDGRGPNLMGRDWLGSLNLTVGVINSLLTPAGLQEILDKHAAVFSNKLGTLKGVKVKLQTKPDVTPQFFKARTIPLALREKVEAELERLEGLGIIIPVQHSEWEAPVVPALKNNGTMGLLW